MFLIESFKTFELFNHQLLRFNTRKTYLVHFNLIKNWRMEATFEYKRLNE